METQNKKWKVKFSEDALKKIDELPDNVYNKLTKMVQGFKTGKLNPEKIGHPVKFQELKIKLKCPDCNSDEVEWRLDKNSNEVIFHCLKCNEGFWMTHKEYKNIVKKNPDKIISSSL